MTGLTYLPEIHAASVLTPPWSVSSAANRASPVHENESIGALDPLRGVGALPVVHLKDISSVSSRSSSSASPTKRRKSFTAEFKLGVVREALKRPDKNRIKPICRLYPQVTPVQLRKWIKRKELLEKANPQSRALPVHRRTKPAAVTGASATCAASIQQAQTIDEAPKESTEYYSAKVAASSHLHAQAKYVGHAQAFYAGMPYGGVYADCYAFPYVPYAESPQFVSGGASYAMREEELLATHELLKLSACAR